MGHARYLITAVAALMAAACIRDRMPEGADLRPGDTLPSFSVTMNDGSKISSGNLRGKVSVIVFFHTGCPDCRQELPVIQRIYNLYGSSGDVTVCCISREESASGISAYWQENGLTMPYSAQEDRSVYSLFASTGVPRVYISSGDLVIYSVYDNSPPASFEDMEDDILACLGMSEGTLQR